MKLRDNRWNSVRQNEEESRFKVLRRVSAQKTFESLAGLFEFVYLVNKNFFKKYNKEKFNILVKTHSTFNNVK